MTSLFSRFEDVSWAPVPNVVEVLFGAPPEGVPVTAAHVLVLSPAGLLLTEVASRGWDVCGGHVELDESPVEAAVREVVEETGVRIEALEPLGEVRLTVLAPRPDGYAYPYPVSTQQFFLARLTSAPAPSPVLSEECLAAEWVPLEAAVSRCHRRVWAPLLHALPSLEGALPSLSPSEHVALGLSREERRSQWRQVCTLPLPARRRLAASEVLSPRSQVRLATDPRMSVRQALAQNPSLLRTVQFALAKDENHYVRRSLARSEVLLPEVAELLALDENAYVLRYLARNPRTPAHLLATLASSEVWVVKSVALMNPTTPPGVLVAAAADPELQRFVGLNRSAPREALELLPVRHVSETRLLELYGSDPRWESVRVLSDGWVRSLGELLVACEELHPLPDALP